MSFLRRLLGGGATFPKVDVTTLAGQLKAGEVGLLLDVRTDFEFRGGHVEGAVNIPVQELAQRLSEIESHKADFVAVICRSGARSGNACGMLAPSGFNVANVTGGMLQWQLAGLPVKAG